MTLSHSTLIEALGWASTAVFAGSYLCARERTLVRAQMVGALMWAAYGIFMRSPPVVAANLLVLAAAAWKSRRQDPLITVPVDPGPTTWTGSAPQAEGGLHSAIRR